MNHQLATIQIRKVDDTSLRTNSVTEYRTFRNVGIIKGILAQIKDLWLSHLKVGCCDAIKKAALKSYRGAFAAIVISDWPFPKTLSLKTVFRKRKGISHLAISGNL